MKRQSEIQAKYDAENTVRVALKLNKKTDADIIAALERSPNKQGLIKMAIREFIDSVDNPRNIV